MTVFGITLPVELVNTLRVVVALIILDAVLGVILAIKEQRFDWEKLPQFLAHNIFPYVGGVLITGAMAMLAGPGVEDVSGLYYLIGAIVVAGFGKSCKDKIMRIFSKPEAEQPPQEQAQQQPGGEGTPGG